MSEPQTAVHERGESSSTTDASQNHCARSASPLRKVAGAPRCSRRAPPPGPPAATITAMPTHGGISEDQRRALCETAVTLDGAPARISGWANPFAAVSRTDGRGGSVEFAWPTAARVVEAGGAFQS